MSVKQFQILNEDGSRNLFNLWCLLGAPKKAPSFSKVRKHLLLAFDYLIRYSPKNAQQFSKIQSELKLINIDGYENVSANKINLESCSIYHAFFEKFDPFYAKEQKQLFIALTANYIFQVMFSDDVQALTPKDFTENKRFEIERLLKFCCDEEKSGRRDLIVWSKEPKALFPNALVEILSKRSANSRLTGDRIYALESFQRLLCINARLFDQSLSIKIADGK